MARPDQEAIDTFISITGASEFVAVQTLEAHGGDLNQAVNVHFSEGPENSTRVAPIPVTHLSDDMDIDETIPAGIRAPPFSFFPSAGNLNPFSLLDPGIRRNFFDSDPNFSSSTPFVTHPKEVREIPIEVKDSGEKSGYSGNLPRIEDVSGTEEHGPETHGVVTIEDDDEVVLNNRTDNIYPNPSAPRIDNLPDYNNDIEEEMIRAAIEASKTEDARGSGTQPGQSHVEDPELAHVVSLSLKTAEQDKTLRELGGSSKLEVNKPIESRETGKRALVDRSLDVGSSSMQDEADDVEGQPLVRRRSSRISSASAREIDTMEYAPQSATDFPEWGGISSEEHDEAVMLEAAMFGGVPETSGIRFPHQFMQNNLDRNLAFNPQQFPRPPSPNLVSQRLIREQQDDEYLASLQADKEKAETQRLEEEAARETERRKKEESFRKLEEYEEIQKQLSAKEASLSPEPPLGDENAVTILVRMPNGNRRGRRFLKSDKLKSLFDFIDVDRVVEPGTFNLVRPYPRRVLSLEESGLSLSEVGLTSNKEALFLEKKH